MSWEEGWVCRRSPGISMGPSGSSILVPWAPESLLVFWPKPVQSKGSRVVHLLAQTRVHNANSRPLLDLNEPDSENPNDLTLSLQG
jgi:hypothetical protein